jgi:hypothetical protein
MRGWDNFLGPPSGSGFVTTSHSEDIHMISITRQSELKDSLQYSDLILPGKTYLGKEQSATIGN